ncbi:MAG: Na(+)-translocating NADH-quinone reductase subunit C, partial [Muribaculum sp.]|nr:Na(+)-translocating NADH-quinone reductase subunit C [Muribaculum sp.]
MNKQSNIYTIIYITVLVVVVGAALAFTALSLKPLQVDNANADKMRQILASVHISPAPGDVISDFNKYVTRQMVIDSDGNVVGDDAFSIDLARQIKLPADQRRLPLYECTMADGSEKFIIPLYGAGLWGPIWGYVALNADGTTVYGAYFAHQG